MDVFFGKPCGVHKQFLSNVVYWSAWIKRERLGLLLSKEEIQMSGDGEERGEGMQERTDPPHPHDVDTLVNALTEDDLRIFYHFCLWLSWISLSCHGESQYEEGRTVTGEWISREHLITSVCGERLILLLKPLCVLDENTVFIWLRQPQQGWGSQNSDVWSVPFQKDVNVLSYFFKRQNLVSCLSGRDGVKMVDLIDLAEF